MATLTVGGISCTTGGGDAESMSTMAKKKRYESDAEGTLYPNYSDDPLPEPNLFRKQYIERARALAIKILSELGGQQLKIDQDGIIRGPDGKSSEIMLSDWERESPGIVRDCLILLVTSERLLSFLQAVGSRATDSPQLAPECTSDAIRDGIELGYMWERVRIRWDGFEHKAKFKLDRENDLDKYNKQKGGKPPTAEAIELIKSGESIRKVARKCKVGEKVVRRWRDEILNDNP